MWLNIVHGCHLSIQFQIEQQDYQTVRIVGFRMLCVTLLVSEED